MQKASILGLGLGGGICARSGDLFGHILAAIVILIIALDQYKLLVTLRDFRVPD